MKHSKRFNSSQEKVDGNKGYTVEEAASLLKEMPATKFDQTVEVHFKLGVDPRHSDQVVRGNVSLPHGTGKDVRVLVFAKGDLEKAAQEAGADIVGGMDIVEKIQGGWLDFDQVVATPDMMPLVGRVARVLGPRGLMPSPKSGTVTMNVANTVKELKAGKISYRVDKGSNVHAPVGKLSFSADKLVENAKAVIESVVKAKPATAKGTYVRSVYMAATMSPSVSLDLAVAKAN